MIQDYIKTGMVVYDDRDKQHFRQDCCKKTFYHYTDADHFPSFQFVTDIPIAPSNIIIYIYDLKDNLVAAFADADFNINSVIYHLGDEYIYVHDVRDIVDWPNQIDYGTCYYLKICNHEDPRLLYYANSDHGVFTFFIDGGGHLTQLDSDDQGGQALDVWAKNRHLYLANGARGLESYLVRADGILTHADNDFQGDSAKGVWGDGNFIYVANSGGGLHSYSADADGILTWIHSDDQGAEALGVWGDGDFIYLANGARGLESYSVDGVGNLTHVDNDAQLNASAYGVWGDGNFIYVADAARGIDSYSVNGAGVLTYEDNHDPGQGADVWGDGNFIYLASYDGGIDSYSVDGAGALTHIDNDDRDACSFCYGIWCDNDYIYVARDTFACVTQEGINIYSADGAGNLTFVNYENPTSPTSLGQAVFAEDEGTGVQKCWYSEAFKVCDCDVEGAGDGINLIENGWMEDWAGHAFPDDHPSEWTLSVGTNATNYVVDAGDACRLVSDGPNVYIRQVVLTVGNWHVFTINITEVIDGAVYLSNGGLIQTFGAVGTYNVVFQANFTDVSIVRAGVTDVTFTDVRVEELIGFEFCDMLTLNWWSDCDWDSIIYQDGFRNSLVLDSSLDIPKEDIVINPDERQGEMFVHDVIIKKRYKFNIRIPEYLWNALIRLPAYGSEMPNFHCWITLPDGSACPMSEVAILGEWDVGNCFNTFTIEFVDNDEYPVVATNCCIDEDISEI